MPTPQPPFGRRGASGCFAFTQQTIATRAFKASERVMFGRALKVRYKIPSRFKSLEGKTNKQGIRWKNNQLVWGSLKLFVIIEQSNPVIQHGLNSPVKYVRILWPYLVVSAGG